MRYQTSTPGSLTSRTADGRWKKLLVFVDARFLSRPGTDYRFGGGMFCLPDPPEAEVAVVDPSDGERWLFREGKWERVGSLIA